MMMAMRGPKRIVWHRLGDVIVAFSGLVLLWPLVACGAAIAFISTNEWPIFRQVRVGRHRKTFRIAKLRTMRSTGLDTTVTTAQDPRITRAGTILRRLKLDEIPQLWNVFVGDMGLVGPRPDVPGYADELDGRAEQLLEVRPGITGAATLLFRNEERLLALADDSEQVNRELVYPTKVAVNLVWLNNATLLDDLRLIWITASGGSNIEILGMLERWEPGICLQSPISDYLSWMESVGDPVSVSTSNHANR